jgi:hypothetical protein
MAVNQHITTFKRSTLNEIYHIIDAFHWQRVQTFGYECVPQHVKCLKKSEKGSVLLEILAQILRISAIIVVGVIFWITDSKINR